MKYKLLNILLRYITYVNLLSYLTPLTVFEFEAGNNIEICKKQQHWNNKFPQVFTVHYYIIHWMLSVGGFGNVKYK